MNATARIGVDVGGTFTDFVLHDPARNLVATGKRLTTPDDPSEAIVAGIARLLEETRLTASEIAQRCGFVDASSFAGQFRQRTGMTPLAYRRAHIGTPG